MKLHDSWQDGSGGKGTCHLPSLTRQKERSNSYTLPLDLHMHMCVHASTRVNRQIKCETTFFFKTGDHEGGNKEAVRGGAERGQPGVKGPTWRVGGEEDGRQGTTKTKHYENGMLQPIPLYACIK